MLRNKELRGPATATAFLTVGAALVCGVLGGWLTGLMAALFTGGTGILWLLVTAGRYKKLQELGEYLASVYAGGALLDIRDNREGELSLLKNDLYKITVTLRQQSDQLEKDKEFLQQLLGNISHQLRTPLTGMLMMADLLARPDLPKEKRTAFTGQLTVQLERMQWLLERLLILSRLDGGCLALEKKEVDLPRLLAQAAAPVQVALELRKQSIIFNAPSVLLWQGDEKWTAEAVTNLIKNASEHAPERGHIWVSLDQDLFWAEIRVEDDGPGISPEDMPHLFQRFYRGSHAASGSAGIGLALAAELVQAQGGTITAENRSPEPGARFTIKLPLIKGSL